MQKALIIFNILSIAFLVWILFSWVDVLNNNLIEGTLNPCNFFALIV